MKKQKVVYRFCRYKGEKLHARKEIPYELKFSAQLLLDEICFNWNKQKIVEKLNHSIETGNKNDFISFSNAYKQFVWE
ncbi:hypothetical protein [Oceanobacillus halophilus]|uniref:IDEAL domain-containing protein n=1 Tax=Oceanobacillus halophilus TaxID=930130 RepID=A0A494ZX86_9BACI|nr:hypothetical protein [Oceanobacillus halophilus]RKQ31254.1 hypothetical protein D8M06_14360 [Oceanobacillus halophilus]